MATINEVLVMQDRFSESFNRYITLAEKGTASTRELNAAVGQMKRDATALAATNRMAAAQSNAASAAAKARAAETAELAAQERLEAQRAQQAAQAAREQETAHDGAARAAGGLIDRLKGLFGAYMGLQGVQMLVNASDQLTQINARLELMTGSAEAAAAAQDKIYRAAQRSRGAYADMANLVSQLGMTAPDTFGSPDELIAFAEQLQKQMAISGASGQSAAAATVQLTQALASGVLRGDELNSVMEQTPMIAKTIADYMGVTTGQLREMASEGQVTAEAVKNAMLSAAEETNAAFEQIPLTWSQVWTMAQNTALQALEPVLNGISWLANNLDTLIPIIAGVTAAILAFAAASFVLSGGLTKLIASFSTLNPVALLIGAAVGVIVYLFAKWVQSVGGLEIAWLTARDTLLTGMDNIKIGITSGFYAAGNALDQFGINVVAITNSVVDFFGDMKVGALENIQGMANGGIDIINWMIGQVNKIPGVSIGALEQFTFAANTAVENEAAKAGRAADLAARKAEAQDKAARLAADLDNMRQTAYSNHMQRQVEIYNAKLDKATTGGEAYDPGAAIPGFSDLAGAVDGIGKDVGNIKKEVALSDENLKSLVDVATGRYVNQVNLTAQTPVITVNGQNTGRTKEDRQALADALKLVLAEQLAAGAGRAIALPV